jgi:outer membrane immunogenic protein
MKKLFLATTSMAALATASAGAADLSRPMMKAPPPPPPPACAQFGGFYVGGQVGATYYDHRWQDLDAFGPDQLAREMTDSSNASKSGWNGGVLAGYNWQTSRCTIFGVEADWSWTNTRAEKFHTATDGEDDYSLNVSSRMKSFGTVRARTGLVVDNLLLYVTGGVAWARFDREFTFFDSGNGPATETEIFSVSHNRWGWTAGVGTEWAITPNVSLKSEVLYIGFTSKESTFTSVIINPGVAYRFDSQDSAWVSRVGLNFRWGGPPAPVMAKY